MTKLGGLIVGIVWMASGAVAQADNPCVTLTPDALKTAIDRIDQARAEAQLESNQFAAGAYPAATQQGLDYITIALGQMTFLRDWLHANVPDTPFVDNTTGVYNIHWYARSAAWNLAYGEHWSAISAVYNHSLHGKAAAELASQATTLLADIGAHGISCYLHGYLP